MEEKYKLQQNYDANYMAGMSVFKEYFNKGKLCEWVQKYMPFLEKSCQDSIIQYYNANIKYPLDSLNDTNSKITDKTTSA